MKLAVSITTFILAVLTCCTDINCQTKTEIKYGDTLQTENQQIAGLMKFLNVEYMKVSLVADLSNYEKYKITCYSVIDGKTERQDSKLPDYLMWRPLMNKDSLELNFYAMKQGADTVKIGSPETGKYELVRMPLFYGKESHILMETYSDEDLDLSRPVALIAYTSGIVNRIKVGDIEGLRQDFCDLRDKHEHPDKLYDIAGVTNFIYFTLELK